MKTLRVRKGMQGFLLMGYTALLLVATLVVQGGHGVRTNLQPFEDIHRMVARASRGDVLSNAFLYTLAGIVGNLAIFAIWGFLAWKFLDAKGRSGLRNTVEVVLGGALFSVGIEVVQFFLPTRAADVNDVFWNVLGALAGALTALASRYLTLEWE